MIRPMCTLSSLNAIADNGCAVAGRISIACNNRRVQFSFVGLVIHSDESRGSKAFIRVCLCVHASVCLFVCFIIKA